MDLLSFQGLFLIIGTSILFLSIPFVLNKWENLEDKGFDPKEYLEYSTVAIIVVLVVVVMIVIGD